MTARDLSRQMRNVRRPRDRATAGTEMAAIPPATAIDAAREYGAIVRAARIELHDMIRAAGIIFGSGFQLAAEELLEQLGEAQGEAVDMYEQARLISEEWMARRVDQHRLKVSQDAAERLRLHAYLEAARIQEARRRLPAGKTRPAWFEKSSDLFTSEPF